jgi:hypothetical protein
MQVRTHAQKHFQKVAKLQKPGGSSRSSSGAGLEDGYNDYASDSSDDRGGRAATRASTAQQQQQQPARAAPTGARRSSRRPTPTAAAAAAAAEAAALAAATSTAVAGTSVSTGKRKTLPGSEVCALARAVHCSVLHCFCLRM